MLGVTVQQCGIAYCYWTVNIDRRFQWILDTTNREPKVGEQLNKKTAFQNFVPIKGSKI
jgi:hypothetical protein